jgi:hypothetical protein
VIEAANLALGLDELPAGAVEVPADEAEMLLELVEVFPEPEQQLLDAARLLGDFQTAKTDGDGLQVCVQRVG